MSSASYRWWFGNGNDVFGLGLGGAWYRVQASIRGEASVDGASVGEASASTSAHAWAPELQLGWRHAFNDHWRMYADASGVKKNGGRLSGHIYNVDLGVSWYPWKNLGFGAEYGYTRIKLNQHRSNHDEALDMKLHGPSLFVKLRF
jgi:outer membrane autotransporter protein